jgi:hypothetical protein
MTAPRTIGQLTVIEEPPLEFRYGQRLSDPRDGIALFGPYDADTPSHPKSIVYGLIGTPASVNKVRSWSREFVRPVLTDTTAYDVRNWPHFPGFEACFDCKWAETPAWCEELDQDALETAVHDLDNYKRAAMVVDMYLAGIEKAAKRDEHFNLLLCVVPDEVWQNCRPLSEVEDGTGEKISQKERRLRARGRDLFDSYDPDEYKRSPDFRRQLKARAMTHGIPIQVVKESTLETWGGKVVGLKKPSPKSYVAWCIATAMYYKAGGKPWRLASARSGVCYIGFAFRRADEVAAQGKRTACCAAQMFLDSGDGIVFKGEFGPWYSPEEREFHLNENAAYNLLKGVLDTYEELDGKPLQEVFLHSRSAIADDEYAGFQRACDDFANSSQSCHQGLSLAGIRVRHEDDGPRLFRPGELPVVRGTLLLVTDRTAYLWSSGFKLRLETYDGFDVPVPLRIDIQHGQGNIEQVAKDILGLTKLNYNTCRLGGAQPVTVEFSDRVGEILISNPTVSGERPQFKFYI